MGNSRFDTNDLISYSASASTMSRDKLYSRSCSTAATKSGERVNAKQIEFRESRDSEANPNSFPILIGLDVTGSMGMIAEQMSKDSLCKLVNYILQHKPVEDPHILFMGIGAAEMFKDELAYILYGDRL